MLSELWDIDQSHNENVLIPNLQPSLMSEPHIEAGGGEEDGSHNRTTVVFLEVLGRVVVFGKGATYICCTTLQNPSGSTSESEAVELMKKIFLLGHDKLS